MRLKGTTEWLRNLRHSCSPHNEEYRLAVGAIIVEEIRSEVLKRTGFHCSAGIGHNKVTNFFIFLQTNFFNIRFWRNLWLECINRNVRLSSHTITSQNFMKIFRLRRFEAWEGNLDKVFVKNCPLIWCPSCIILRKKNLSKNSTLRMGMFFD